MTGAIDVVGLTKRFGPTTAVDDVSFSVQPGQVTGFLGRNGAGKTTTLRVILGLERPTAGTATVDGRAFAELHSPLHHVGSLLDARAVQPGTTATRHLLALARSNGIARRRVGEVLRQVGLGEVGRKPARTFSLGMLQRLGLAAALLGDPPILVLDEPLNGLDPEGIIWFRGLMRSMAAEGRAVLVSSHLMSEMSVTADRLLVIGEGRLLVDSDMHTFQREHEHEEVRVCTPDPDALRPSVAAAGGTLRELGSGTFMVSGLDAATIGSLALSAGVQLDELTPVRRSLEDAFMELTSPATTGEAAPAPEFSEPTTRPVLGTPGAPSAQPSGVPASGFRDVLASELVKFTSTRTGPLLVAGTIVATIGTAFLLGNTLGERYPELDADDRRSFDPTFTSLHGRSLSQVSLSILGALAMTAEYGADTMVPSLTAVPDRTRVIGAKAITTAGIGLLTGLGSSAGAFLVGQSRLARHGAPRDDWHTPGSLRAVFSGGLYAAADTLLGLGIGTLTRSSAGAIATIFSTQLLVPGIGPTFPEPLSGIATRYWPTEAGSRIFATRPDPDQLTPWTGFGLMAGSTAALLGAALAVFNRRDV